VQSDVHVDGSRVLGQRPVARRPCVRLRRHPDVVDPWVDYAARYTFDYHYDGAGNWPFNTAYAAHFGVESEVTQLQSLAEAEQFVKAGIPLVASIAFEPNKLDGFLFRGTDGHLLVIGGFTADGDVISYDPASSSDAAVRHVYDRDQFEKAWMTATGGIVYVIHPASVPLPPSPGGNW
jgi:Peptidase_C39 like family